MPPQASKWQAANTEGWRAAGTNVALAAHTLAERGTSPHALNKSRR